MGYIIGLILIMLIGILFVVGTKTDSKIIAILLNIILAMLVALALFGALGLVK